MGNLDLIEHVRAGEHAKVEALIKDGADVNQQDDQGWTPLNYAAGKGDLPMVKLLVENGADIFKVGRDQRDPYLIALAAGRVSVARYLRDLEASYPGEKPQRPERAYCKAYHLQDLRGFPCWSESRINWKSAEGGDASAAPFPEDKVVFIHQDFTVTESMWHGENVIFDQVDSDWVEFCTHALEFKVPDDLDLAVAAEAQ